MLRDIGAGTISAMRMLGIGEPSPSSGAWRNASASARKNSPRSAGAKGAAAFITAVNCSSESETGRGAVDIEGSFLRAPASGAMMAASLKFSAFAPSARVRGRLFLATRRGGARSWRLAARLAQEEAGAARPLARFRGDPLPDSRRGLERTSGLPTGSLQLRGVFFANAIFSSKHFRNSRGAAHWTRHGFRTGPRPPGFLGTPKHSNQRHHAVRGDLIQKLARD